MVPIIGINEAWSRQVQGQFQERSGCRKMELMNGAFLTRGNSLLWNAARQSYISSSPNCKRVSQAPLEFVVGDCWCGSPSLNSCSKQAQRIAETRTRRNQAAQTATPVGQFRGRIGPFSEETPDWTTIFNQSKSPDPAQTDRALIPTRDSGSSSGQVPAASRFSRTRAAGGTPHRRPAYPAAPHVGHTRRIRRWLVHGRSVRRSPHPGRGSLPLTTADWH